MDIQTIKSNISKNLRELMKKNPVTGESISVQKLANFLGISAQAVYYYLSGKTYPEYTQLIAIAGYFGVTTDYLLTGTRHENIKLRESLHLSDAAINNLESCDKELAPFVDKLLSDKEFFTTYQAAIKDIQDTRKKILDSKFIDSISYYYTLEMSQEILKEKSSLSIYAFFKKFYERLVKNELPAQGNAGGESN